MIDASATRNPFDARTRSFASTTARRSGPILHVPTDGTRSSRKRLMYGAIPCPSSPLVPAPLRRREIVERAHLDEFARQLDSPDQDLEVGVAFQVVGSNHRGFQVVARAQADATVLWGRAIVGKNVNPGAAGSPRGRAGRGESHA